MTCPTNLLDDNPATEDELGAHDRVARAMAELIQSSEKGGKLIGLEGRWGSGKSTVISLMERRLARSKDTTTIVFDAWAHERDPLRRTFLEDLIRQFQKRSWIVPEDWDTVLERLAKRRKSTKTTTVSDTTPFGKMLAFSALFVPSGAALMVGSFRRGVTFGLSLDPNVWFLLGALLACAPLLVVFVRLAPMLWKRVKGEKVDVWSGWAVLTGNVDSESTQDTWETPEPTSLEFERDFGHLMCAALSGRESKTVVIVLDNLDRVAPEDALNIWSTLQTFIQSRNSEASEWFKRLWIVVPYDKTGLSGLWSARHATSSSEEEQTADPIAESFLDKSFQIRFEVPPPVLSNWRDYLLKLICKALPEHEEDARDISRIYSDQMAQQTEPPTPRELKLYVNQIGALYRQWGNELPLSHLAYYVALQRRYKTHRRMRKALVDGEIPESSYPRMFGRELRANLAGLLFNVEATLGEQLLLAEPIFESLSRKEVMRLDELEATHQRGFWLVLEDVVGSRLGDAGPAGICPAAVCLSKSRAFVEGERAAVSTVIHIFGETVRNVDSWFPFGEDTVSGIVAACRIVGDPGLSEEVLESVRRELREGEREQMQSSAPTIIEGLASLGEELRDLGHTASLSQPFTLPGTAGDWTEDCVEIANQDESLWPLFRSQASRPEIASLVGEAIQTGQVSEAVVATIRVTGTGDAAEEWHHATGAVEERLSAHNGVSATEGTRLLRALYLLERHDEQAATKAARRLSTQGHLLHLFYQAQQENDVNCKAWCLVSLLLHRPDAMSVDAVGNSPLGQTLVEEALSSADPTLADEVIKVIAARQVWSVLFAVIDARGQYDSFVLFCLRQIADSTNHRRVYTADATIERWWDLHQNLPDETDADRFSTLLGKLCESTDLVARLQEREFNPDDGGLYMAILDADSTGKIATFCRDGLETIESETWASYLAEEGDPLSLLTALRARNAKVALQQPFQDALVDYAEALLSGDREPSDALLDQRLDVVSSLKGSQRRMLRKRLLDAAIESGGRSADSFFHFFGDEIARGQLKDARDIVGKLFSGLIRERATGGLEWLHGVLKARPSLLESFSDTDAVSDFRGRVQRELSRDGDEEDEARRIILRIADVLEIVPAESEPASHEEAEE
ncbi:MAG: hypothetical protein F4205_11195 [Gemmatimonadetes bacterium]|nr:hypothetical protein [Gemmatimonadota bacterium]